MPGETETQLFRIAQEALTNIVRHASATVVRMRLASGDSRLSLTISDNGCGFVNTSRRAGLGLVGMRARARTAGGTLKVTSTPGQGVTIEVELPVQQTQNAAQNPHLACR